MKGNKGITLIALVITIIVLLILAGVSIAMLSGDNSILSRGNEAATLTAINAGKEKVALAINEALTEFNAKAYGNPATSTTIASEIDTKLGAIDGDDWTISGTSGASYTAFGEGTSATFVFNVTSNKKTYTATISDKGSISWKETDTTTTPGG